MKRSGNILLIDVGSSKIRTALFQYSSDGTCTLDHNGVSESTGFNCGTISEYRLAVQSLKIAVDSTFERAGLKKADEVWVGHSGSHVRSENVSEEIELAHNQPVTERIEKKMFQKASARVPKDHELLHCFQRCTLLDGIPRESPLNLIGNQLHSNYHVIYSRLPVVNNIRRAFKDVGLDVTRFLFNGYSASMSVLEPNDKALGCLLIHLGASACDYIVFQEGRPYLSGSINEGWSRLVKDIAMAIHVPPEEAERLMHLEGSTSEFVEREEQEVRTRTLFGDTKGVKRRSLNRIMSSAADDILISIRDNLKSTLCRAHLPAGVVLTGGAALTNGLVRTVMHVFGVQARIGLPVFPLNSSRFGPESAPLIGCACIAVSDLQLNPNAPESEAPILSAIKSVGKKLFPGPKNPSEPEGEPES